MKKIWEALPEPVRGGSIVSVFSLAGAAVSTLLVAVAGRWAAAGIIAVTAFAFGAWLTFKLDD